jgi:hypothetical protein
MSFTVQTTITMISEVCINCGVVFAMPDYLRSERLQKGGDFYCPNGHGQHFSDPIVPRLERQLAQERQRRDQAQAEARDAKVALAKAEDKAKRTRKRIGNGVCPCCKRTFKQLAEHMKCKHPEYAQ